MLTVGGKYVQLDDDVLAFLQSKCEENDMTVEDIAAAILNSAAHRGDRVG